jgi:hypothetical protein
MATQQMTQMGSVRTTAYAQTRWAVVRVETEGAVYVGRLFIPETKKRLSDVLCDDRPFLNMTDVTINHSSTVEAFVAVNKAFVKNVRVIEEDDPRVVQMRGR